MTRLRWTEQEVADLSLPWSAFLYLHPRRSYDSYEVKRRRVAGGSAGTNKRQLAAHAKRVRRVERALRTIAEFAGVEL